MENVKMELEKMVEAYGADEVRKAIENLMGRVSKPVPAEHIQVLSPKRIEDTVAQLDSAVSEVLAAGDALDAAYKNRGELLSRKAQLEGEIKLEEAQAIMEIRGEARSQYIMVGDEKVLLTNDTARDAYRRMASKTQREELAGVEAQLAKLDAEIEQAKEKRNTVKEANDSIRAKGHVQAALLNYLR
jgi:hypothetical protein